MSGIGIGNGNGNGSGIGSGIGSGSDIAKSFKDPALVIPIFSFVFKDNRDTVLQRILIKIGNNSFHLYILEKNVYL